MNPVRRVLSRQVLRHSRAANLNSAEDILRPCVGSFWGNCVEYTKELQDALYYHLFPKALMQEEPLTKFLRGTIRENKASEDDLFSILRSLQSQNVLRTVHSLNHTNGLEVDLVTGFINSSNGKFVFAYNVLIRNVGIRPIRVIGRNYEFRDGTGRVVTQITRGSKESMGICGYTPLIEPNSAMLFGSGISFRTPEGSLEGSYTVCFDHKRDDALEKADVQERYPFMKKLVQEKNADEKFEAILGPVHFDARISAESVQNYVFQQ